MATGVREVVESNKFWERPSGSAMECEEARSTWLGLGCF